MGRIPVSCGESPPRNWIVLDNGIEVAGRVWLHMESLSISMMTIPAGLNTRAHKYLQLDILRTGYTSEVWLNRYIDH